MERKQLLSEVDDVLDMYCQGCFLNQHFRKAYGKNYAQSFCLKKCTVGQRLKEYGEKLSDLK